MDADVVPAGDIITGQQLETYWPSIVQATHPEQGLPFASEYFKNKRVVPPINLDRFLAIRCRAVSAFEHHGPNVNGDGFESTELQKAHHTLVFKGFYIEHKSYDPANAKGMNIHSEFIPWDPSPKTGDYVMTISLIDKIMFPREAEMIRDGLASKRAGVSIGCIAGQALCSQCGNIARRKDEICECMDRKSSRCIKGKRNSSGGFAGWDLCRDLMFYELTGTWNRADRDALPVWVMGADITAAVDDKAVGKGRDSFTPPPVQEKGVQPPVGEPEVKELEILTITPAVASQMVKKDVNTAIRQRIHKLVKDIIDRKLGPTIKEQLGDIKPTVEELVEEKKEIVEAGI